MNFGNQKIHFQKYAESNKITDMAMVTTRGLNWRSQSENLGARKTSTYQEGPSNHYNIVNMHKIYILAEIALFKGIN